MQSSESRTQVQDIFEQLRAQVVDLQTLLSLLTGPLDSLGLLPPQFRCYSIQPLAPSKLNIKKHIPQLQRVLLQNIAPTWDTLLAENNATLLLDQYFCPDSFSNALPVAGEIAILAYSTLVSSQMTGYALRLLERLSMEYPLDRLHTAVFARNDLDKAAKDVRWEDCVRDLCMVPAKVANALGVAGDIPLGLENGVYFNNLSVRCEQLIFTLSKSSKDAMSPIAYLLTKLVNIGIFPPSLPVARSQPSFFHTSLPSIRRRLKSDNPKPYSDYWSALILTIPSSHTLQSILTSVFVSLPAIELSTDAGSANRARVKQEASLLNGFIGSITPDKQELWEIGTSLFTSRDWDESHARIFVCWLSGGSQSTKVDLNVLDAFLENILEIWSSPEHIKHSLISRHRFITYLLLITVSYFPPSSQSVQSLASAPNFIKGIGLYISHLDNSVRHCGMLAAEVIAELCDKKLNFDDWDGDESGKPWCRDLRQLLKARDVDATLDALDDEDVSVIVGEVSTSLTSAGCDGQKATFVPKLGGYDSDDSMLGYASSISSRSSSPSPSELAEVEKDPTLNVGVKKVSRPVYLAQLGDLFRGTGTKVNANDPHEADRIEMALNSAEELIRKKRGYGTELDENAVNLVYALLSLHDNFDLEGFAEKRQAALNALISSAPRKAPHALIEEFFKNQYSTDQRYVALNALATGARELASLPIPVSRVSSERISFPSKMLPAPLHRKYISAQKSDTQLLPLLMDEISRQALHNEQSDTQFPEIIRQRRLRLQKPRGITEVSPSGPLLQLQKPLQVQTTKFTDVAAEFFIMPFINRFWMFLRDEQTREERTSLNEGRGRYRGAGTGLILNPLVLSHVLRTLGILVNASHNAPEWLAIIGPESLELAITIGTRPVLHTTSSGDLEDREERQRSEASVLTSSLELALVVLSGSLEIDGGKTLSLEHTTLILGVSEWATEVFSSLEKGIQVQGGGGLHETKLSRTAAGVLLKSDELRSKWGRSMSDTR